MDLSFESRRITDKVVAWRANDFVFLFVDLSSNFYGNSLKVKSWMTQDNIGKRLIKIARWNALVGLRKNWPRHYLTAKTEKKNA